MLTRPTGADATLFQALIENSADAIALLDERGTVRFSSQSIERVLGYTPAERMGRSPFDLVHPDDLLHVQDAFRHAQSHPGVPVTCHCRIQHKNGSWRDVEAVAVNRIHEPDVAGMVINYRDVTERIVIEERLRRSEARYRSLIQNAAYGIFRTSIDGVVIDANPAFIRMLGYDSFEELKAINIAQVYESQSVRDYILSLHRTDPGPVRSGTVKWRKKDGSSIIVQLSARLVDLDGNGFDCFEAIAEDITEKRALEEQLRESQKMEAVGRLARGIAHDFNNLLAAILGSSDLLMLELKPSDPRYTDAAEIGKAAERGAALTRQLLDFSRRQAVDRKVLDLHAVVSGFDLMLQRLSGDIPVHLHTQGDPPLVRMEAGQIEQIVMNLVVNARDASPEGGSIEVYADSVTITPREQSRYPGLSAGRYARIAVHDHGAGIDPKLRSHVFEPFFSTKDPAKGSGLGLSIVYGIAKEAGGTVTFHSRRDEGTTFEVLIPTIENVNRGTR